MPNCLVAILALFAVGQPRLAFGDTVRVVVNGSSIWSIDSIPNVLTVVKAGTVLQTKELRAGWYIVVLPNNPSTLGCILARLVRPVTSDASGVETPPENRPPPTRSQLVETERTLTVPTSTGPAASIPPTSTAPVASDRALDAIVKVRALFSSAAFQEALGTLAELTDTTPEIEREANQYRALCLYALGRTAEAEAVAEVMIRKEPLVRLDESEVSPHVQDMFTSVRKRLLPGLIRDKLRTARSLRDANNLKEAEVNLKAIRGMLDEAEHVGARSDTLDDQRALVDGLLDLTRVYRASDAGVRPPIPIPPATALPSLLEIDQPTEPTGGNAIVVVSATGTVEDCVVRESGDLERDEFIRRLARSWKFRPAMRGDMPVRYRLAVTVKSAR